MKKWIPTGVPCLLIVLLLFGYLASVMGLTNMINTIINTAHDLLLNTVFYLMGMCVITGALGKVLVEFGVVDLLQRLLRPVMKPLFNMPGVASLGAVLTFLSDNPAIIALSQDRGFARYFKKYQHVSLVNFGTAFGMGLLVIVFMVLQGYFAAPFIGFAGAICGCIIATRLMQYYTVKDFPSYKYEDAVPEEEARGKSAKMDHKRAESERKQGSTFIRLLNSLLDGGKEGVAIGLAIIPGVLIISTFVMMMTFGGSSEGVDEAGNAIVVYTGAAYQGTQLLPWLAGKISFVFEWLFGFQSPELIAFPITALGAVGAALGLIPEFSSQGIIDGNAIAVFTAMGMCWSGYLSTDAATLDSLGYRALVPRAFFSTFMGGICAGIISHWSYVAIMALSSLFDPNPVWTAQVDAYQCLEQEKCMNLELTSYDDGTFVVKNWYGEDGHDLKFTVNEQDSSINVVDAYAAQNGYYFVHISNENQPGVPSYAAIYPGGDHQSEFVGNAERGSLYVFAAIYDCRKRMLLRGYYELVWGGAPRQTIEAEEAIKVKMDEERQKAIMEADSILKQQLVDSLLMKKQIVNSK